MARSGVSNRKLKEFDHFLVPRGKRRHGDVVVLIDDAGHDLVRVDLATGRIVPVETIGAPVDVHLPGLQDVLGHGLDPFRAIDRQRLCRPITQGVKMRSG